MAGARTQLRQILESHQDDLGTARKAQDKNRIDSVVLRLGTDLEQLRDARRSEFTVDEASQLAKTIYQCSQWPSRNPWSDITRQFNAFQALQDSTDSLAAIADTQAPTERQTGDIKKRYQVFVSSTKRDLAAERLEVITALLNMACLPASMEFFPASDESSWDLIKKIIDDCDYYVVIVAGMYGSLVPDGIDEGETLCGFSFEPASW